MIFDMRVRCYVFPFARLALQVFPSATRLTYHSWLHMVSNTGDILRIILLWQLDRGAQREKQRGICIIWYF